MSALQTIEQHAQAFRDFAEDYADEHSLTIRENKTILNYLIYEYQAQLYSLISGEPIKKLRVLQ